MTRDLDRKRKVTLADVAEHAGVNKSMVSRAFTPGASIAPASRDKVLRAAKQLGYRPNLLARGLTQNRSGIIGVVVDDFVNPNTSRALSAVSQALRAQGLSSLLLNVTTDQGYEPTLVLADQLQVDGVLFLGAVLPDEFVRLVQDIRHIPLIVLYRSTEIPDVQSVSLDDIRAGRELGKLLFGQGYRRFAALTGPPKGSTQVERLAGMQQLLGEQGLSFSNIWEIGSYSQADACAAILAQPPEIWHQLDAVMCENDSLALGLLDAISLLDLDLAVVGVDGVAIGASPKYQLTTYEQPVEVMAAEAVRRLKDDRNSPEDHYQTSGELVLRESHIKPSERK